MPASYPGSVKAFASRSAGQTIAAAHVNDLQDEVNAIEAGLLNGTAPLSSSNSTVGTLSVTGNSTFTNRPTMPPPDCVRVITASSFALVSTVSLTYLTQSFATNSSLHSTATNPERFTPQSTGVYRLTAGLTFAENSSGRRRILLVDSTGTIIGDCHVHASTLGVLTIQAIGVKRFDVTGGYLRVTAEQALASTMSIRDDGESNFALFEKL